MKWDAVACNSGIRQFTIYDIVSDMKVLVI